VIDTHAHLQGLEGGPDAAIAEAVESGVGRIVCIGASPREAREAVELAVRHEGVYATAGLHPHEAASWDAAVEAELDALLGEGRIVAVGECGLDYYRDHAPRDAQARAFEGQIALAERHSLPLVVHTREAAEDTLARLREARCTVVLHCFSLPEHVDEAAERGWYVSFAGNVTYPAADALRDAAARTPEHLLLLETDSPYLAPLPHRGRPNRPVYVLETLRAVAAVREVEPDALGRRVEANAQAAFGLP